MSFKWTSHSMNVNSLGETLDEKIASNLCPYNFGLCNKCRYFIYIEFEHHGYEAKCERSNSYVRILNSSRRIKNCTNFEVRGQLDLYDMANIAWDIQFKSKIGFVGIIPPKKTRNNKDDEDD